MLILVSSALQVMLPVVISVVVVDHVIMASTQNVTPDMGMIDVTEWIQRTLGLSPLAAACVLFAVLQLGWAITGHYHRLTLIRSVINGLRDLRLDLFRHLETRPSSFYDRVAVGRIMTRVTNDIEALYELLRGIGTLIGEFVPFFVALVIMLAVDVKLTRDHAAGDADHGRRDVHVPAHHAAAVPPRASVGVGAEPESAGEPRRPAGGAALASGRNTTSSAMARSTRATATWRCGRCGSRRCTARSPTACRRSRSR